MPSSPNYQRNYQHEYATETSKRRLFRAERDRARRLLIKNRGISAIKGKDVDHKTPLSQGGSNNLSNLRAINPSKNRSYPRNPNGSMKKGK